MCSKKFNAVFIGSCSLLQSFAYKKAMDKWISEQTFYKSHEFEVISKEEYDKRCDEDVIVLSLFTQKPVTIKAHQRGGVSDPSTEKNYCF